MLPPPPLSLRLKIPFAVICRYITKTEIEIEKYLNIMHEKLKWKIGRGQAHVPGVLWHLLGEKKYSVCFVFVLVKNYWQLEMSGVLKPDAGHIYCSYLQ